MAAMCHVRAAVRDDIDAMVQLQKAMALETEGLRLDEATLRRGMTVPFERENLAQFYVVEDAASGTVVAMMMTTQEWSEWRAGAVLWIQSVYVVPAWRRRGLFRMLYEHVRRVVQEDAHYQGIRLYVERDNSDAMAVYQRLGMTVEHYNMMKWMKGDF
ncbi:putative acetyltransferase [Trypanosoma grayi]|uniref:putative acetyltransferase n=1 Tax=Trypanosoma grayi TaxID=71804 RepID=UPI0004F4A412|nr:putative acetyltransferase [Trypanosoma grayi]KEG07686.1 putative acetyltransferase [Trypanosoma grayi]